MLRHSHEDASKLSSTPLRKLVLSPRISPRDTSPRDKLEKPSSWRNIIAKLSPRKSNSLTSSPVRIATPEPSPLSNSEKIKPFQKRQQNYLSKSASNVEEISSEYRRSSSETFDEDHCYTCNCKIPVQDGILLALKCACSEIKSFHNGYCLRVHWIYNRTCKYVYCDDLEKPVTLEDVYNQAHLYDSAESD